MKSLDELFQGVKTVAIAGHVRPDGDCVGSCLATYNYITTYYPQIEVSLYLQPIPNIFKFMKNSDKIISDCTAGTSDKGSITGLYTVLVDGDDMNEPITDTARSILDGHIMLSRKLGHKNHYPAIDVLQSISRVMSSIATSEHKELAGKLRNVMATYNEAEDLINIGAYKNGTNREIDYAIQKIQAVNEFLIQKTDEKFEFREEIDLLRKLFEN